MTVFGVCVVRSKRVFIGERVKGDVGRVRQLGKVSKFTEAANFGEK